MRRARIKAVANLSARRPAVKSSTETEVALEKPCDTEDLSTPKENVIDCLSTGADPINAVESKSQSSSDAIAEQQNEIDGQLPPPPSERTPTTTTTFKTPLLMPRNDCEQVPANDKAKHFKTVPRLNAPRQSVPKANVIIFFHVFSSL